MAEKKYIPEKLKLLILIINRGKANFYLDFMEQFDVNMQMVIHGEGTAPKDLNNLWGLAHKERDIILSLVKEDNVKKILKELDNKFVSLKNGNGVAFTIAIGSIIGVAVYQFLIDNRNKKNKNITNL